MRKVEEVLTEIQDGKTLVIARDKKGNLFGVESTYDGNIEKENYMVDVTRFTKAFPNISKQIADDKIYHLSYNEENNEYINTLIDRHKEILANFKDSDIYGSILLLENNYTNFFIRLFNKRKIKKIS